MLLPSEAQRLDVLRSYRILDTLADPAFDRLTALASDLFDAPIALISFIDEDRQWFKAHRGMPQSQTPRAWSFCDHAIRMEPGSVMVVEDALEDVRFADNPLVTGAPAIRFYAGAVLTSAGGNLGTLCVIDTKARPRPSARELDRLTQLAGMVVAEIERPHQARLASERQRLLELAETQAGVGRWRIDVATGKITWSDLVYAIHGVKPGTFDPNLDEAIAFYHPDDRDTVAGHIAAAIASKGVYEFELRLIRSDGAVRDVVARAGCQLDDHGEVIAVVGLFQDITEQKQARTALEESEARYRLIAENTSDVIVKAGLDGKLKFVSTSVRAMGHDPEALVGSSAYALVHPDDLERFTANSAALFAGEPIDPAADREHRYQTGWGAWVWMEGSPQVIRDETGRPVEIVNILRDVTERRSLREEAERLSGLMALGEEVADVAYYRFDVATRELTGTRQLSRIYGLDQDRPFDLDQLVAAVHPDDQPMLRQRIADALERGVDWRRASSRIVRPNGEVRHLEGSGVCQRDDDGVVGAVFGTVMDVTDRVLEDAARTSAQAELQRLSERALLAAQAGKVGIWEHDLATGELLWDARMFELYGIPDDLTPNFSTFMQAVHPEDRELLTEIYRAEVEDDAPLDTEFRVCRPDGSIAAIRAIGRVMRDATGAPVRVVGTNWDVTAVRELESSLRASEARYRLMAENSSDVIVTTGLDGRVVFVSPSCEAATGFTPDEIRGLDVAGRTHAEDLPGVLKVYRGLLAGKPGQRVRWRLRHKITGELNWFESNPTVMKDPQTGAPVGFLDVVRDVSAQVAQEDALAQTRAEAEAAAAVKAEFLSNMSHEIRTPLTAVIGFSNLLAQQPELAETSRGYVRRVSTAGRALMSIVNDILDFSKLEAGQVDIAARSLSPEDVVRDALAMFEPQASAKGLELEFEAEPGVPDFVLVDGERLTQILLNLIGNAVKFTETGWVRARLAHGGADGRLRISVADTGPGMTADQAAGLFQRFAQVDASRTRQHGGTGLGLAICKGLCEAMDGSIGVVSTPGAGAVFSFDIAAPIAAAPEAVDEDEGVDVSMLDGARVLVVDDNPMNRELAAAVLEQVGVVIAKASDGQTCLDLMAQERFDVVLLDLRMPGLSGWEVLTRIRQSASRDTPVLAFTADDALDRADHQGRFDGLVSKPMDGIALILALADAMGSDHRRDT